MTASVRTNEPISRPARRTISYRIRRPSFLPRGRRLSDAAWAKRHLGLTLTLWAHIPAIYVLEVLRGSGLLPAGLGCCLLLIPAGLATSARLSRNVRSASTSIGLIFAASFLAHLFGGAINAHFQFLVVIAFLSLNQAWLPFLLALGYIVLEHGLVGAIDPGAVYNSSMDIAHPWRVAAINGGFVLVASFANLLAWRLTEQEALSDGLTGLPNRAFFLDFLAKALESRNRSSIAVLFLDLDNFKDANDGFGHEVGDRLLQGLSERLQCSVRNTDRLARMGGDEFAVTVCDFATAEHARAVAERILKAVCKPFLIGGVTLTPSASIGLAFADTSTQSATDLLRNADLAMYEAKRNGGGRVAVYEPVLHSVALKRTELDTQVRAALDSGEFVVYYQPIFNLESEEIVATEALVRWNHPTRGIVPPSEFIPVAEQSGLIVGLGSWVLREACRQTAAWQAAYPSGTPLAVSVNLSPRQLNDPTLVGMVSVAMNQAALSPSSLCLEITETAVITDFEATTRTLHEFKALGVSIALDDFGTGYSSLTHLKKLPVDSVKIDGSFVANLGSATADAQIVLATIQLAHALGMSVTAEGVETATQLKTLRKMKSDRGQGYLLGKPITAQGLTAFLADRARLKAALARPRWPVLELASSDAT